MEVLLVVRKRSEFARRLLEFMTGKDTERLSASVTLDMWRSGVTSQGMGLALM